MRTARRKITRAQHSMWGLRPRQVCLALGIWTLLCSAVSSNTVVDSVIDPTKAKTDSSIGDVHATLDTQGGGSGHAAGRGEEAQAAPVPPVLPPPVSVSIPPTSVVDDQNLDIAGKSDPGSFPAKQNQGGARDTSQGPAAQAHSISQEEVGADQGDQEGISSTGHPPVSIPALPLDDNRGKLSGNKEALATTSSARSLNGDPTLEGGKDGHDVVVESKSKSTGSEGIMADLVSEEGSSQCDLKVAASWSIPTRAQHLERRRPRRCPARAPDTSTSPVASDAAPRPAVTAVLSGLGGRIGIDKETDLLSWITENRDGRNCVAWFRDVHVCLSPSGGSGVPGHLVEDPLSLAHLRTLTDPPEQGESQDDGTDLKRASEDHGLLTDKVVDAPGVSAAHTTGDDNASDDGNTTSSESSGAPSTPERVPPRNEKQKRLFDEISEKRKFGTSLANTSSSGDATNDTSSGNTTSTSPTNVTEDLPLEPEEKDTTTMTLTEYEEKIRNQTQTQIDTTVAVEPKKAKKKRVLEDPSLMVNYASSECGGKVRMANAGAKAEGNVLSKNRDAYALSPCSERKFLVIELCDNIYLETLAIGNFEFHSSMFREFQLLGAKKYPTSSWLVLGTFEANNTREMQYFHVSDPAWVRFIQLRFFSHYGQEYYCTISSVKVHGSNYIEHLASTITNDDKVKEGLTQAIAQHQNDTKTPSKADNSTSAFPSTTPLNQSESNSTSSEGSDSATAAVSGEDSGGVLSVVKNVLSSIVSSKGTSESQEGASVSTQDEESVDGGATEATPSEPVVDEIELHDVIASAQSEENEKETTTQQPEETETASPAVSTSEGSLEAAQKSHTDTDGEPVPPPGDVQEERLEHVVPIESPPGDIDNPEATATNTMQETSAFNESDEPQGEDPEEEAPVAESPFAMFTAKIRELDEALMLTKGYLEQFSADFSAKYKAKFEQVKSEIDSIKAFQFKVDNQTLEDVETLKQTISALPNRIKKTLDFYADSLAHNLTRSTLQQEERLSRFRIEVLCYVVIGVVLAVLLVRLFPAPQVVATPGSPLIAPDSKFRFKVSGGGSNTSFLRDPAIRSRSNGGTTNKKGRFKSKVKLAGAAAGHQSHHRPVESSPLSNPPTSSSGNQESPVTTTPVKPSADASGSRLSRSASSSSLGNAGSQRGASMSGTSSSTAGVGKGKLARHTVSTSGIPSNNIFDALDLSK